MLCYISKFCTWIGAIRSMNTGLVKNGLRAAPRMNTWRCWERLSLAHQCARVAQKTNHILDSTRSSVMSRLREGIYFSPLLCPCEIPPKVLHPREEGCRPILVGMGKGHKDDQTAGAPLLGRQAERDGTLPTGEQKAPGRPYSTFLCMYGTTGQLERDFSQEHVVLG